MDKEIYPKDQLLHFYQEMFRIRFFETRLSDCFIRGELSGNIHVCIGQEATAVGACQALEEHDYIVSTHRGHGHCLAKGAQADRMMAEIFGKATGYCGGKGGSLHVADVGRGILGANGIVGGGFAIGTGSAMCSSIRKDGCVTLVFYGDGASNQGTFHESMNIAATWRLPVVFLCENNQFAVSVRIRNVTNVENLSDRAVGYQIPGVTVDGNDVLAVYEAVKEAVDRARRGEGPSIVECKTVRYAGHFAGDPAAYRTKEELEGFRHRDCIPRFREQLRKAALSEEIILAAEQEIETEIKAAYDYAVNAPLPEVQTVMENVYKTDNERGVIR